MNVESLDIDRLVREVVRRLAEAHNAGSGGAAVTPRSSPAPVPTPSPPADRWRVSERLLTLSSLASMPPATRVLEVPRGTVVTPAVRDRLRQLRVVLEFGESIGGATVGVATATIGKLYLHAVAAGGRGTSPAALAGGLGRSAWTVEPLVAAPLPQAVAELAAVLDGPTRLAVLLAPDSALAVCLANRRSNVRAVAATDKSGIESAVRGWAANLLVLDPTHRSPTTLRGLVEVFVRSGPRSCPPDWQSWLER